MVRVCKAGNHHCVDNNSFHRKLPTAAAAEARFGGRRLVLVASQSLRARSLLAGGPECGPLVTQAITAMQWCILERIGRSRELGEVTQGKRSLQFMKENPKTLFYHRKDLIKKGLLRKQIHYQKTRGQNYQVGRNCINDYGNGKINVRF